MEIYNFMELYHFTLNNLLFYLLFFLIFNNMAQLLVLSFQQNGESFNLILQLCLCAEITGIVRFVFGCFCLFILFFQFIQIVVNNNRATGLASPSALRIVFLLNSGSISRIFFTYFVVSIIGTEILGCFRDIIDLVLLFIEIIWVIIVVYFFHICYYYNLTKHNHYYMEIIALIAILYFLVGACICLLICVNPNDPGALGSARRFVFTTFPSVFSAFVRRVFGERVLGYLSKAKYWLMQTNHPLVQWFYLLISPGGFTAYTMTGIFKHMPNQYISDIHIIIAYVLAGICFWVYYKACSVSPGEIKDSTFDHYVQKYKHHYDGIMYKQNNKCTTCSVTKPARSKHCSVCKMCVSKFDHHCIWIRQCVGQKNYKYFVSFLFLHSVWCSYLSVIGAISLYQTLVKMKFWDMQFRMGNQVVRGDNLLAIQYLFVMDTLFFFLIVMCAIMGITLGIFVFYHFYLIGVGQTTNQRVKKNDYIDYLRKQKKGLKKYTDQHPDLPEEVDYKGQKMPKKQFLAFQQDVNWRLSVLEKKTPNPGFWANLKTVFSQPDK